jgi:hypothetical protein
MDGKSPKLRVKAAEARGMLKVVDYMLEFLLPIETEHQRMRFTYVNLLRQVYTELEHNNWNESSAARVFTLGRKHVLMYCALSCRHAEINRHRSWEQWRMYPKHHQFLHILEDQIAVQGNPRLSWCYADESAIGNAARLAEASHPKALATIIVAKWRLSRA